jgi:hypothetical protein
MTASITLFDGASSQGYRIKRIDDIVVVTMQGAAFATTGRDHTQVQQWARARASMGNAHRDRAAYCAQHQTLLARKRGGLTTRGSSDALAHLVRTMRKCGMSLDEWSVPERVKLSASLDAAALDD